MVVWLEEASADTERRTCPMVPGANCVAIILNMAPLFVSCLNFTIYNRIMLPFYLFYSPLHLFILNHFY